ncbi:transmembrane protein, putative [Medicago truncatula]|uniref:Transmembrane protein, putative n=1 Tax=Medicago truncatula TaxID=3880 RepID=G7IS40_MEDTR|nr:transmembrane protein, putative [Medicago truncatula]
MGSCNKNNITHGFRWCDEWLCPLHHLFLRRFVLSPDLSADAPLIVVVLSDGFVFGSCFIRRASAMSVAGFEASCHNLVKLTGNRWLMSFVAEAVRVLGFQTSSRLEMVMYLLSVVAAIGGCGCYRVGGVVGVRFRIRVGGRISNCHEVVWHYITLVDVSKFASVFDVGLFGSKDACCCCKELLVLVSISCLQLVHTPHVRHPQACSIWRPDLVEHLVHPQGRTCSAYKVVFLFQPKQE